MNNEKILIIGAGLEQSLVIKKAKQMGLYTIAIDSNPNAYSKGLVDEFLSGDIRDENFIISTMRTYQAKGMICHAVDIPISIAKACTVLNLKTSPLESVITASDKVLRMKKLKENGINCANFAVIYSLEDLNFFWNSNGGNPIILKPIDNSGSRGVIKIDRIADLEFSYSYSRNFTNCNYLIAEEFLVGHEISTESIIANNKIHTFAIADRNYSNSKIFHPYFVEDGINYPSSLPEEIIKEIRLEVERTIKVLGLNHGVAKGDVLVKDNKPYIIEMAPRSSGGWFGAGSMKFATGVDYIELLIKQALDLNITDFECIPKFTKPCAQRYLIPTQSGILKSITYPKDIFNFKNVKMIELFLPSVGNQIEKAQNHSQRFAQVICTGDTLVEAIKSCENVINSFTLELE